MRQYSVGAIISIIALIVQQEDWAHFQQSIRRANKPGLSKMELHKCLPFWRDGWVCLHAHLCTQSLEMAETICQPYMHKHTQILTGCCGVCLFFAMLATLVWRAALFSYLCKWMAVIHSKGKERVGPGDTFGIQAACSLHLLTTQFLKIKPAPIWIAECRSSVLGAMPKRCCGGSK